MLSQRWLALILVSVCLALASVAPPRLLLGAEVEALVCPSNQVTMLRGEGPPSTALLVFFAGRAVGGGLSDAAGRWEIPLLVRESQGSYPVEVRTRASEQVVKRFECFVDQPITTPSASATGGPAGTRSPTSSPTRITTSPTVGSSTPTPRQPTSRVTPTPTGTATSQDEAGQVNSTPTIDDTATATPSPTTAGTGARPPTRTATSSRTATSTATQAAATTVELVISDVVGPDPVDATDLGYVVVENRSNGSVNLAGWSIGAQGAGRPRYTFTSLLLRNDNVVILEVGVGSDQPGGMLLYWNRTEGAWESRDLVVLYRPDGTEENRAAVP